MPEPDASIQDAVERFLAEKPADVEAFLLRYPRHADELREILPMIGELGEAARVLGEDSSEGVALTTRTRIPAAGSPGEQTARASSPASSDFVARILARVEAHGYRAGRFRIEDEISRGGQGVVLAAWDETLQRHLAMKVALTETRPKDGKTPSGAVSLGRFLEEAQVTAQLDHPGIVPVHDLGLDPEGRIYFTMKLVRGRDLRRILELVRTEEEGWSRTRALGVLLKVCEAMAYAHSKGVIHRDLKPANIMVGHFGEVYVMDWGLARATGRRDVHDLRLKPRSDAEDLRTARREEREETPDSPLVTMDGVVLGTPAYMSPEQARGEIERISSGSDVYSLGAVLYHLLAGAEPYADSGTRSSREIVGRLIAGPPPALRELAPGAPPELVAICQRAMARDPEQRYPDMTAMRDDLRAYLEGRVVRAHESGALAELRKWIGRNRILSATAAAGILALAAGFATSSRLYVRAAKESERANAKAEEVLRLSDLQELDDLTAEADAGWPILPESAPALGRWLDRAHRLLAALPEHERKLAALGTSTGEEDRWWRNQLTKLVQGLKALDDPETGLIAGLSAEHGRGMRERFEFARSIRERSVDGPDAAGRWREARASIRDRSQCPRYDGLELGPQLGLLPIGRDPASGLWEFAHLESGEPARRGPDGRLVLEDDTGIVLVLVPGGESWMGRQGADPAAHNYVPWGAGEEPDVHEVSLDPFFLSKYEMTQGQWSRFAGKNPSEFFGEPRSSRLPVEQVDWHACVELTRRLGLVLPTEAQWEHAARAGTDTPWWTGSRRESLAGAANLGDRAWQRAFGPVDPFDPSGIGEAELYEDWLEDGQSSTCAVGSFAPNPFGLFDVAGNVCEWCRDEAASYAVGHREGDGELKFEHRENHARILRGGSWQTDSRSAAAATRGLARPEAISWDIGLRPARAITRE